MLLSLKDIKKTFGHVTALKAVDLEVEKGEVRALLGGNGSGKSTLAKILSGIYHADEGEFIYKGEKFVPVSPIDSHRRGIVITSQELSLLDNLTVAENICLTDLPTTKTGAVPKQVLRDRALEVLKRLKLEDVIDKKLKNLPQNIQYLIEFAKALVTKPELLVIDEITSPLYRKDVEIVRQIIKEEKERGCTIIFISHRMNEIFSICDSVTVLRNGISQATFEIPDASHNELLSLMTGDTIVDEEPMEKRAALENPEKILEVSNFPSHGFNKPIDFDLYKGEIVCIAGLQGHGQSTLLRQMMGLYGPAEVTIDGKKTRITAPGKAIESGFGFISGDRTKEGAFLVRSIRENLNCVKRLVLREEIKDEKGALAQFGVVYGNVLDEIQSLSGGNQQKVIIARWVGVAPKILMADDPTKGIDVNARTEVHKIFEDYVQTGSAVLMVSSDDEEIVNIARRSSSARVFVMYEGEIVKVLHNEEITLENIIAASMPVGKEVQHA